MKKKIFVTVLGYSLVLLLSLSACKNRSERLYVEYKSKYLKKHTTHFPNNLPENSRRYNSFLPLATEYINYWGFDLLIKYENEEEKNKYLQSIQEEFIDTLIKNNDSILLLTTIKYFCDSTATNKYTIFPVPDIQNEILLINYSFLNGVNIGLLEDTISFSPDWNDYHFYLIEFENQIIYEEQKNNSCLLLERELGHGFSRGVMLNEKDKILFFWLYFW